SCRPPRGSQEPTVRRLCSCLYDRLAKVQSIPASEMVMRAQGNVYHVKCFTCATCRNRLMPGDRFHYINGTIFCEHDRPGGGLLSHPTPLVS
ncbi:hypothetical protein CRUP_021096, partial [Coryphaenoides rupestris]